MLEPTEYTILYYTILYHMILCYTKLYYMILYYTICIIIYHTVHILYYISLTLGPRTFNRLLLRGRVETHRQPRSGLDPHPSGAARLRKS